MLSDRCLFCLSVCDVRALWPNGWTDEDELGMVIGLSPGDFVLDENQVPHKFSAHVYHSYCDFVRTLHNAQSLLVCSSSSSSLSILCILFSEKQV